MSDDQHGVARRLRTGADLPVRSTKYDGSLHYSYTATVVADLGDRLYAYAPADTPLQSYRGDFPLQRAMLSVHDLSWDYNVEVGWDAGWVPRSHYVNIALPSTWDDGVLRFVDVDLDISWRADGRVVLLDEDEFAAHRMRFGYPADVVARAWAAVDEVVAKIGAGTPPLDGALYEWRPGRDLAEVLTLARES